MAMHTRSLLGDTRDCSRPPHDGAMDQISCIVLPDLPNIKIQCVLASPNPATTAAGAFPLWYLVNAEYSANELPLLALMAFTGMQPHCRGRPVPLAGCACHPGAQHPAHF